METRQISKKTMQDASDWFARLTSGDATRDDQAAFVQWIDQSPEHKTAYENVSAAWISVDHLDRADLDQFAREASAEPESLWGKLTGVLSKPLIAAGGLASAASVAGILLFNGLLTTQTAQVAQVYQTEVGGREEVILDDGSKVTLNTATKLTVAYSEGERTVSVDHGEAFFEVAPDENRPFRITAGDGVIEVLGTRFNVRLYNDEVRVAVVEGRVSFFAAEPVASAPLSQTILTTGESGRLLQDVGLDLSYSADIEQITAWREGRFIFRATPLPDVVSEINRYSALPISLGDGAGLSELEITASLLMDDIPDVLTALEKAAPITVEYDSNGVRITASEP